MVWYFHLFQNFPQFIVIHRLGWKEDAEKLDLGRGSSRPEQPLGRGSALSRLGAELELRRYGSSLGPSQ